MKLASSLVSAPRYSWSGVFENHISPGWAISGLVFIVPITCRWLRAISRMGWQCHSKGWVFVRVSLVMLISWLRVYLSGGWGCGGGRGSRWGGGLFVC